MQISRREFLKICGVSAAALGLSALDLDLLDRALANPNGPNILWVQGAGCSGCSVSFLNTLNQQSPIDVGDVLIETINLMYHPQLMAAAGETATQQIERIASVGSFILIVEGGIPTAFNGAACHVWEWEGRHVTCHDAVTRLGALAQHTIALGTCAAYGGIPAAGVNPAGIVSVASIVANNVINISGCPIHPDWLTWVLVEILLGHNIELDNKGRPANLYNNTVHKACERRGTGLATTLASTGLCLARLGCKGPRVRSPCPAHLWNEGVSWCIGANSPCLGCVEDTFPGDGPLVRQTT